MGAAGPRGDKREMGAGGERQIKMFYHEDAAL